MQERVLSRRNLMFTKEQVHFVCNEAKFSEEAYCEFSFPLQQTFSKSTGELSLKSSVRAYGEPKDAEKRFWGEYSRFVRSFSLRTLSYAGDVHDAFAAITAALNVDSDEIFLWGIPTSQFELGLSWITYLGQDRRKELTTLPMTDLNQRVHFPSWSWMGWIGETCISVGEERLEAETPAIRCYVHENSIDGVSLISISEMSNKSLDRVLWRPEQNRVVDLRLLKCHLHDLVARLSKLPSHHILFFWTSQAQIQVSVPPEGREKLRLNEPELSFLCIDCHSVEQHLSGANSNGDSSGQTSPPNILDSAGNVVGTLSRMHENFWKHGTYNTGMQDFIVLGRRHIAELGDEYPATLLVMQVEQKDGLWHRLNMGEVSEDAWNKVDSKWSLIALG